MSTTRARTRPRNRRPRAGRIFNALLGAIGLVAFVVGVPLALRVISPMRIPETGPTWEQIRLVLSRPDDGTLLFTTLTLVVWAGWAWLTLGVLIELAAAITRIRVPSIPLLGLTRATARSLLATAGLVLATATPLSSSGPAHATTTIELVLPEQPPGFTGTATAATRTGGAVRVSSAAAAAERYTAPASTPPTIDDRLPVITVARGDSLWRLAERHLGNGQRYREIRTLNLGQPQPGGDTLDNDGWLYPGWHLRLPADAANLTQPGPNESPTAGIDGTPVVLDVVPGDTLWDLAERHLGDGNRYPELVALNTGVPQPGGETLSDPDLIKPGWHLALPTLPTLPAAAPAQPTAAPTFPDRRAVELPPSETPDESLGGQDEEAEEADLDSELDSDVEADQSAEDDGDVAVDARVLILGLTALAAAGVTGELARRRRRQLRLRHVGERIARPDPGSSAATTESALRHAPTRFNPPELRGALHLLGPACLAAGRDLPRVVAALVDEESIDLLLLDDDTDPVDPFVSVGPRTWNARFSALTGQDRTIDVGLFPLAYPALVSVGVVHERIVLINLEAAGTFAVNGPDHVVAGILRAIACELATSDLSADIELVVGPEHQDLADVSPSDTVRSVASGRALSGRLVATAEADARVLEHARVADALRARATLSGDETWIPTVFLAAHVAETVAPWAGHALVTSARASTWRLDVDGGGGGARLEPLGLRIDAQQLATQTYDDIVVALRKGEIEPVRDPAAAPPDLPAERLAVHAALPQLDVQPSRELEPETPARVSAGPEPDELPESAEAGAEAPRVLVLGPVTVTGVAGNGNANREGQHTELVAFLALNPGATRAQLDEVCRPGERIKTNIRNQLISRARVWLGTAPDGRSYLPKISERGRPGYGLDPAVRTDLDEFRSLVKEATARDQIDVAALHAALDLIRGRPFLGVPAGAYIWAERLQVDAIQDIVDAAHLCARAELGAGNYRLARAAAAMGLSVEPSDETLFRDAIEAAHLAGDVMDVERLSASVRARVQAVDPGTELEVATRQLLQRVQQK